jgi:ribosomal protein S6
MFIIKPDLSEEEKKNLFSQIQDVLAKNDGKVSEARVWQDKRKLFFPIKRCREAAYYLVDFNAAPLAVANIRQAYKLNENILRVLITRVK